MPFKLYEWENTAQDRNFRNRTNDNWRKIENAYGAIEQKSDQASKDSIIAKETSSEANKRSKNVQTQLDTIVVNGDSSPEAAQARVDNEGHVYSNLKERLDTDYQKNTSGLESLTQSVVEYSELNNFEVTNKYRKQKPLVTFSFDDGFLEDYTKMLPLFNSKGIRATTGIVTNWIGTEGVMNLKQIKELQDNHGWEIASHSKTHSGQFPLKTDEQLISELKDSKEILINYGLDVKNFLVPFGATDKRVQEFCRRYYRATRVSGSGASGIQNYMPVNMQALNSILFGDAKPGSSIDKESGQIVDSLEYFKYYINQAKSNNGWLIFIIHSRNATNNGLLSMLGQIIDYIQSINVDIVTMNEGLNYFGNIVDTFDFRIGADGKIGGKYGKIQQTGENSITNDTPLSDVDSGYMTFNVVTSGGGSGFPNNGGGTLVTVRPDNYYNERSFQLFHEFGKNKGIYFRDFDSTSKSSWMRLDNIVIHPDNLLTYTHTISDLTKGKINYCYIQTGSASGYPENKSGLLVGYRMNDIPGVTWEEYRLYESNSVYTRYYRASNSTWSDWQLQVLTTTKPYNSYIPTQGIADYPKGITFCDINNGHAAAYGFPEGKAGVLETRNILGIGYIHQYYHLYDQTITYKRVYKSNGTWGAFVKSHD